MRPRTREAVSGRDIQSGSTTFITCATSILSTGSSPMIGYTWFSSDAGHCRAGLVGRDVFLAAFPKGHLPRRLSLARSLARSFVFDWIDALVQEPAGSERLVAGFGERYHVHPA
jgi:hypothetical protein